MNAAGRTTYVITPKFPVLTANAFQYFPNGNSFGLPHRMVAVFELLNMLGYWKDKVTDTSNYARL